MSWWVGLLLGIALVPIEIVLVYWWVALSEAWISARARKRAEPDDDGGVTAIPATTEAGRVRMCICGHPGSEHPTAQTCRGGGPHYSCHCWLFWAAADSGKDPT